jgi:hypothetical protein
MIREATLTRAEEGGDDMGEPLRFSVGFAGPV